MYSEVDDTKIALAGGGGSSSVSSGGSYSSSSSSSSFSHDSDSSGGSSGGPFEIIVLLIFFAVFIVIFIGQMKYRKRPFHLKVPTTPLDEGRSKIVTDTFIKFQADWSSFNTESMHSYMTDSYYGHNLLMMNALKQSERQNQVDNVVVHSVGLVNEDDSQGRLRVAIQISATDTIKDTRDGEQLFSQKVVTTQYYKFVKSNDTLLLDGVDTDTASESVRNRPLEQFADEQGYFYSLDWGWLLLPRKGQLFGAGSFGVSDINNHIIGQIGESTVQVYTYSARPGLPSYLIAQVAVPKEYGNILVQRKGSTNIKPKGLNLVSTEWRDFNDKYQVYASDIEQITSLELLHPVFMEKLEALPFAVNIEVVDNVVYLFTLDAKPENYRAMMDILKDAYQEMKR